jgi:ATP-dependent Clp protease ATP-binding subunit ClpB
MALRSAFQIARSPLQRFRPVPFSYQQLRMVSDDEGNVFGNDGSLNPAAFSGKAWAAVNRMPTYARMYNANVLEPAHLLKSLLDSPSSSIVPKILESAGISANKLDGEVVKHLGTLGGRGSKGTFAGSEGLTNALARADSLRKGYGDANVDEDHLLLALADTEGFTKDVFTQIGGGYTELKNAVRKLLGKTIAGVSVRSKSGKQLNLEALAKYGRDLTRAAEEGKLDPVIGRDEEIRRAVQILSRRYVVNMFLVCLIDELMFLFIF